MPITVEQIPETAVHGEVVSVYVTYEATYKTRGNKGSMKVTGERTELTDFESALSEEATLPIITAVGDFIEKEFGESDSIIHLEVLNITVRSDNDDLTSTYLAFLPGNKTLTFTVSAEENIIMSMLANMK